ncbi:hypothetical protein PtA15_7A233 [Puccinia triticina]|uniref:Uncharacterized protein n=1 Tax=Puccinia triticina TaxID=208348 RepID=A0ABY7CRA6_9BASI|nr:uncharacterized protein PtA15_7A233 [Puccinia triticina]WAQ86507.1 hypothetical protein PtA15_7A233 [Puccinia triticina]
MDSLENRPDNHTHTSVTLNLVYQFQAKLFAEAHDFKIPRENRSSDEATTEQGTSRVLNESQ